MSGDEPAKVGDHIEAGRSGSRYQGLLAGMAGLYSGMRGHERVAVLLAALGVAVLPAGSVEAI
jgi:hypothetical protein